MGSSSEIYHHPAVTLSKLPQCGINKGFSFPFHTFARCVRWFYTTNMKVLHKSCIEKKYAYILSCFLASALTYDHRHGAAVALTQRRQDLAHDLLVGQHQVGDAGGRTLAGPGGATGALLAAADLLLVRRAAVGGAGAGQRHPAAELSVPGEGQLHQHVDHLDEVEHQLVARGFAAHGLGIARPDDVGEEAAETSPRPHRAVGAAAGDQLVGAGDVVVDQEGDGLYDGGDGGHGDHAKALLQGDV